MSRIAPVAVFYLDLAEAAEVAGMGKKEFDTLVRRGLGPAKVRLSNWGSSLFRDDQLLEWIAQRRSSKAGHGH